jgi:hypothetical protein
MKSQNPWLINEKFLYYLGGESWIWKKKQQSFGFLKRCTVIEFSNNWQNIILTLQVISVL